MAGYGGRAPIAKSLLLAGLLALAGCVKTGIHHQTADEMRFPAGDIFAREADAGGKGPGHHVLLVRVYPDGTNVTELGAELRQIIEATGWRILSLGNVTGHVGTLDAINRYDEYLSCEVGRATAPSDEDRGVPLECRIASLLMSYAEPQAASSSEGRVTPKISSHIEP